MNRYRYVIYKGTKCIEMSLNDGQSCIFDIEYLDEVVKYKWYSQKHTDNLYVIKSTDNQVMKTMHRLIFNDDNCPVIDHINGDSRINLINNLRASTSFENAKNCKLRKDNNSGINGLNWRDKYNSWRYRWEENRKTKCKCFSVSTYGSKEDAFNAAIVFKKEKDEELGNTNGIRT